MKTEVTRIDEEIFLNNRIAGSELFSGGKTATGSQIIDAIRNKKIPLQVSEEDGTEIISDSDFEEIRKAIPWLFKIVQKPRSFIRSYEEKVPVETAKRINFKAIAKLGRDSNDWYDRTILTVKPKNIVSDVSEETYDIYENRFIVSLIDRVSKEIAATRIHVTNQINALGQSQRQIIIDNMFVFNKFSFGELAKLETGQFKEEDTSFAKKLKDRLADVEEAESKLSSLRSTPLYKELRKTRRVKSPIQKTNILTFDYAYNQAYKLWLYLDKHHHDKDIEKDLDASKDEIQSYYSAYCFLCVLFSLIDLKFKIKEDAHIGFSSGKFASSNRLILEREKTQDKVSLEMRGDIICVGYLYNQKFNKWDYVCFYPDYTNFEGVGKAKVDEITTQLLDKCAENDKCRTSIALLSLNLARCSENNRYGTKLYRRFFSYGNDFDESEEKEILDGCSDYKVGIAIVTCSDIRNNLLKIEKSINQLIIRHKVLDAKELSSCPICGSTNIKKENDGSYVCHDCQHFISINYCSNCDPEHKHPIVWVKYQNDKFLDDKSFVEGDGNIPGLNDSPVYEQEKQIESLMGEFATTAFRLEKENDNWKLKTVCPRCGVELGVVRETKEEQKPTWHDTRKKNK